MLDCPERVGIHLSVIRHQAGERIPEVKKMGRGKRVPGMKKPLRFFTFRGRIVAGRWISSPGRIFCILRKSPRHFFKQYDNAVIANPAYSGVSPKVALCASIFKDALPEPALSAAERVKMTLQIWFIVKRKIL